MYLYLSLSLSLSPVSVPVSVSASVCDTGDYARDDPNVDLPALVQVTRGVERERE